MPPGVVTRRLTVPLPAGEVARKVVALSNCTLVPATAPKATVAPLTKFVPVMVTTVPPDEGPVAGVIELTVGIEAV